MREDENVDGEDADDLARLLFERPEYEQLQSILLQRVKIRREKELLEIEVEQQSDSDSESQ